MIRDFIRAWNYYPVYAKMYELIGCVPRENRLKYTVTCVMFGLKIRRSCKRIYKKLKKAIKPLWKSTYDREPIEKRD